MERNSKIKGFILCICLLCCVEITFAQEKGIKSITQSSVEAQLSFLASDALQGRAAGSNEALITAEYIASLFKTWGIKPYYPTGYFQTFEVKSYYQHNKMHEEELGDPALILNNVVGYIEGKKKDEFVIVGAHFDHLGINTPKNGDSIYNGADDNASGTVAVLQLAKAFASTNKQPYRTLVFALWDGEELGIKGSYHFINTEKYVERIKAYVNFDMIGRNKQGKPDNHFVFYYTSSSPIFEKWMKKGIKSLHLDLQPEYTVCDKPTGGSDDTPFATRNIPIVWFHTDDGSALHKPFDEVDGINFRKASEIIRSAYYIVNQLSKKN